MPTRILIVDDSSLTRDLLRRGLSAFADIEIVGEATDGLRAERMVEELRPDVVTMDVVMPMMGGLEAIRAIMARRPTAIVVVASPHNGLEALAMEAMAAGALDVFPKAPDFGGRLSELVALLRQVARVRLPPPAPRKRLPADDPALGAVIRGAACIGIVSSAGGPQTLKALLSDLPASFPVPIAIVQHTTRGFGRAFATWLGQQLQLAVAEAQTGDRIEPDRVLLAPDDMSMQIGRSGTVALAHYAKLGEAARPGNALLRSLAGSFGARAVGIVLTGMGDDGSHGLHAIEQRNGTVIVQDPDDAVIDGMPSRAIERTRKAVIGTIAEIASLLGRVASDRA